MSLTIEEINIQRDDLIQRINNEITEFTRRTGAPIKFMNLIDVGIEVNGSRRHQVQVASIFIDAAALFL